MQLLLKRSQSEGAREEPHEPNRCRFRACDRRGSLGARLSGTLGIGLCSRGTGDFVRTAHRPLPFVLRGQRGTRRTKAREAATCRC